MMHRANPLLVLLLFGLNSGCDGVIEFADGDRRGSGSSGTNSDDPNGVDIDDPNASACQVPSTQVRLLNNIQYDNTVRDLLGTSKSYSKTFPGERVVGGFHNNAEALTTNTQRVEEYANAAEALSAEAVKDLDRLVACEGEQDAECAARFIQEFGRRAFRRPLAEDEVARYQRVFANGAEFDFASGIEFVINAMLQSKSFLYSIENVNNNGLVEPYAMASKLSYFLWNSMPDDELLASAESSQLIYDPGELPRQVERMLADERSRDAIRDFVSQWLDINDFELLSKSSDTYPEYSPELVSLWKEQILRFAEEAMISGAGLDELMTGRYTFVNDELAELYDLPAPGSDELTKVELPAGRPGGILGQPGLVAMHGGQLPSIGRGQFVLSQLLCEGLPPPPDDILPPESIPEGLSLREYTDAFTSDGTCAVCHSLMNPYGHALGEFDGLGRVSSTDAYGLPVDASVELPLDDDVVAVDGATELATAVLKSTDIRQCFVRNWYRYAASRVETKADACSLNELVDGFDGDVRALLLAIVTADTFTKGVSP